MKLTLKNPYLFLALGDVLVFLLALYLALGLRSLAVPNTELVAQHALPFGILCIAWIFIFFLAGLYGKHTRMMRARLPQLILYTQIVNVAIAALFFFFIPYFGITPKSILFIYLAVSFILFFFWRLLIFPKLHIVGRTPALIFGSGEAIAEMVSEINNDDRYPIKVERAVDTKSGEMFEIVRHICQATLSDKDMVVVADLRDEALSPVLPLLYNAAFSERKLVLMDIRQVYQDIFDRVPLSYVRYDWVLSAVHRARGYDVLKRILDIVVSLFAGLGSLLVYPFVMLAIKLEDGGSVFIAQERVGRYGEPIHMYKFRSMSGSDKGTEALKSKLVVTRVGKFLRKSHLDELPQLWNVFRGDLSFVGPRPELPALVSQYDARIPYYNARHLVTPGLSGWARIRHTQDPHHGLDIENTKHKLAYDLYYLKNRSFLLDIYIMLQTLRFLVGGMGR
jgi:lipopolysaccharide/colanic/teichoic acid biosynthesis glycosyltransferase